MCDPLYPHPPFTADVMTAILVSGAGHHQHHVPPANPQQDNMDASSLTALAPH